MRPYITRTVTYMNPQLDGLIGAEYRRRCRYLSSIGELLLTREVREPVTPKYELDENGRLLFANLTAADIASQLDRATRQS
ncbi:hypothetical protein [Mycolicibacterium mageritense]|uniref:hypothetical protein n=1 Tax=Mycolicibacterium mageritense TaxID=53462 RepID=UPI0011D53501|nr:hypothetical protein [Mycolicibacterium mageritense]TXI56476.1 MAG: hypothetical protein E6Q55_28845 [Mycolicibacterium mageritense]